jgi:hypothetical protein
MRILLVLAVVACVVAVADAQGQNCGNILLGETYTTLAKATIVAGGWTPCYIRRYSVELGPVAEAIQNNCSAFENLLVGCGTTGAATIRVAAAAPKSVIFTPASATANDAGTIYGTTSFYYTADYSMGFAPAGASVSRTQCDQAAPTDVERVCYHLVSHGPGDYGVGGRCAEDSNLGDSNNVDRIVYGRNNCPAENPCVEAQATFQRCTHAHLHSQTKEVSFAFTNAPTGLPCIP